MQMLPIRLHRIAREDLSWASEFAGRTELPSHVPHVTRERWPAASGNYVGFRSQKAMRPRDE